jgi:hypothetical protein
MVSPLLFLYIYFPVIISQISSFYVEYGVLIPVFLFSYLLFSFIQEKYPSFSVHISLLLSVSLLLFYSLFYQYGWAFLWTSKDTLDARQQRTLAACKLPEQVSILVFPAE